MSISPSALVRTSSVLDPTPFWPNGGFQAVTMHQDVHYWFSELPWTNQMPHRSAPCLVPYTPVAGNLQSKMSNFINHTQLTVTKHTIMHTHENHLTHLSLTSHQELIFLLYLATLSQLHRLCTVNWRDYCEWPSKKDVSATTAQVYKSWVPCLH